MNEILEITVCMGSSCFARGNEQNLRFIENFIEKNNIQAMVELSGSRCEGRCADGPNVIINGIEYSKVNEELLENLLTELVNRE